MGVIVEEFLVGCHSVHLKELAILKLAQRRNSLAVFESESAHLCPTTAGQDCFETLRARVHVAINGLCRIHVGV